MKVWIYYFLEFRNCFNEAVNEDGKPHKALLYILSINTLLNIKQANPHRKNLKIVEIPCPPWPINQRLTSSLKRTCQVVYVYKNIVPMRSEFEKQKQKARICNYFISEKASLLTSPTGKCCQYICCASEFWRKHTLIWAEAQHTSALTDTAFLSDCLSP